MSLLREFIIGSSVSIFPLIYLGSAYANLNCGEKETLKIDYGYLASILPIFYGMVYIVLNRLIPNMKHRLFILGAIAGEIYSLIGHFGLKIPETLLKSKNPNMVHIIAPIMYSLIYGIFVKKLENEI